MSYLKFEEVPNPTHKTRIWNVRSADSLLLGRIGFYPQWRKYVFSATLHSIFDAVCLEDIVNFLKEQTEQWRNSL